MNEQELNLQMGTKPDGYEEMMKDYTYNNQEEIQEYSEEPLNSSNTQDEQLQDVTTQTALESISEPQNYNLSTLLPYIGLLFTLTFLFFIIKECIKAYIWSRFFK